MGLRESLDALGNSGGLVSSLERLSTPLPERTPLPSDRLEEIKETDFFEFFQAAGADIVAGPFVGLAQRIGIVPKGTREQLFEDFKKTKDDFLNLHVEDRSLVGRTAFATGVEIIANIVPILPGGALANVASKVSKGGKLSATARGLLAGGSEGLVVGAGDSTLLPEDSQLAGVALPTALGGTLGAAIGRASARTPISGSSGFRKKYVVEELRPEGGITERLRQFSQDAMAKLVDDRQGVESLVRRLPGEVKEVGLDLVQRLRASRRASVAGVHSRTVMWDEASKSFVPTGKGLEHVLRDLSDEHIVDLENYLLARKELELGVRSQREGSKIRISKQAQDDALQEVKFLAGKYGVGEMGEINLLDQAAFEFREWSKRSVLLPLRAAEMLDDGALEAILRDNRYHVIYSRALRAGAEGKGRPGGVGHPLKKIGRGLSKDNPVLPPIQEAVLMAQRVSQAVDKQLVRKFLSEAAEEFPDLMPRFRKRGGTASKVGDDLQESLDDSFSILDELSEGSYKVYRLKPDKEGVARRVLEDWEAPKDVMDALEDLTPQQTNFIIRTMRPFASALRAGATTALGFTFKNPLRDQLTAFWRSQEGFIPFWDSGRIVVNELYRRATGRGASDIWKEYGESGAAVSSLVGLDRVAAQAELREARKVGLRSTTKRFFSEWAGNFLYPLQVLSELGEKVTRIAEAGLAREGGRITVAGLPVPFTRGKAHEPLSSLRAARRAAEVSLNFSRRGTVGGQINSVKAFFNAEVQDFAQSVRLFREQPLETSIKVAALVTLPAITNWARNWDDPDYQQRPEWEKRLYLHVAKDENGRFWKIPRPLGVISAVFGVGTESALHYVSDTDSHAAKRIKESLVDETPIGAILDPGSFAKRAFIPTAAEPIIENITNYDLFFERKIIPDRLAKKAPELQFTESTPEVFRRLGKVTGTSPLKLQNIVFGYVGTQGRDVARLIDVGVLGQPGVSEDPQVGFSSVPFAGSVARTFRTEASPYGFDSRSVSDFYDMLDSAVEEDSRFEATKDLQERKRILSHSPEILLLPELQGLQKWLSELSSARRDVLNTEMSREEKAERLLKIDQAVSTVTSEALERWSYVLLGAKERIDRSF